jgi:GTP pyrophosphokinase
MKEYLPELNEERVYNAYEFAKKAHESSKNPVRASGEPYIQHPLEAAKILLDLKPDEDSVVAAIMHDVLEDTSVTVEEIRKQFGESVIPLLQGLEKLGTIYYRGRERQVENLRKMFLAMAKDIRVIIIKLADRLHNMRTLAHLKPEKQKRIARETLTIYSPIASRLGIYRIKNELDDLCFKHLYPERFERLIRDMEETTGMQKNIIKKSKNILKRVLQKYDLKGEIEGRVKHYYSIYKKLQRKDKNYVSELYDIFALRIIVNSESECYQVLGIIHKNWTPLTRRFKDYISRPKPNGYQSLHTTIIGLCDELNNQPVEIQIRTEEMNRVAKYGIAAHWQYKEKGGYSIAVPEDKLNWVQNLVSLHETLKNNSEFIESLSVDIFHDRIFVVTPKGDVIDLPRNATPVDFAYAIHTEIGHRCKGARVEKDKGGKEIVPLDYKLKNNEVVEIITANTANPNRYWLSFVVSSHAKSAIKQWFNQQEKGSLVKLGKEMINKHLKRLGKPVLGQDLNLLRNLDEKKLSVKEREELLERIGNGSVEAIEIIKKIFPEEKLMLHPTQKAAAERMLTQNIRLQPEKDSEVLITGQRGVKTQLATCCQPTVEDEIIGYITRGKGVTIHKEDCKVLRGHDKKRFIKASWGIKKEPKFDVRLKIERQSRVGLIRDVGEVLSRNELQITNMNMNEDLHIDTSVDSVETLDKVIHELEAIPDIYNVKEVSRK